MLYLAQITPYFILSPSTSSTSHTDAGSKLSCLSLVTQGDERVQRAERNSGKTQEKHQEGRTILGCTVFANYFTQGKKKSSLHLILARVSEIKPHLQATLAASQLAKTHSPKVMHRRQQPPASKHLTEGQLLGEELRSNHLCKYHLQSTVSFSSAVSCKSERRTPPLLQVVGKIHRATPEQPGQELPARKQKGFSAVQGKAGRNLDYGPSTEPIQPQLDLSTHQVPVY